VNTPEPPSSPEIPDLTPEQFAELLAAELHTLAEDVRPTYQQYAVPPVRMERAWMYEGRRVAAPVWVVARAGNVLLVYDEVEEEFGIGTVPDGGLAEGGEITDWGTFGPRLRWTLMRFPDPVAYIDSQAG
jgi:hypothetical protein